jgi:hypothetical protein
VGRLQEFLNLDFLVIRPSLQRNQNSNSIHPLSPWWYYSRVITHQQLQSDVLVPRCPIIAELASPWALWKVKPNARMPVDS